MHFYDEFAFKKDATNINQVIEILLTALREFFNDFRCDAQTS